MKRFYIAILITICGLTAMAQDRPDMTHQSTGRDRGGIVLFADRPTLVFNSEENQIEVYGNESDYYNVTITRASLVVYTATIDGNYDVIDVSNMSNGIYVIALTSSRGNTYQWTFNQDLHGNNGFPEVIDKSGIHTHRLTGYSRTPNEF